MLDQPSEAGISDQYAIDRMFELARAGEIDHREFALLDAVIQSRLREAYDDGQDDAGERRDAA